MPYCSDIQKTIDNLLSVGNFAGVGRVAREHGLNEQQVDRYLQEFRQVPIDKKPKLQLI